MLFAFYFFFQAEDGIRDPLVTGVQTCALPIYSGLSASDVFASLENIGRQSRMAELERALYYESQRHRQRPIYGTGLFKKRSEERRVGKECKSQWSQDQ